MIKVNFTPKKDIEQYLTNDFNVSIYNELTENKEWEGTFEPLQFLNLFHEKLEIINANKDKPLSLLKHLKSLDLEPKKLFYLLYNLKRYISLVNTSYHQDTQLNICKNFIEKEYYKLKAKLYPIKYENYENIFKETAQSFQTINDLRRKTENWAAISNKVYNAKNNTSAPKERDAEYTEAIKKQFNFFTKDCPRKGKQILNDDDFDKLINWTIYYYENDFKIPEIKEPIKVVNTNMTYVILAFRYLFKELYPLNSYPESLFIFFTKAFKPYSGYKKTNFDKVKNNKFVKELMNINK